jgi:hypothetical protein
MDWNDYRVRYGLEAVRDAFIRQPDPEPEPEAAPHGPRLLTGPELFAIRPEPVREVVHGFFPAAKQGCIYGGPGIGKSMAARHVCGGITADSLVFGQFGTDPGAALYVTAEEGLDDIRRGFAIVAEGAGYDLDRLLANLFVVSVRDLEFSLTNADDRTWLEEQIGQIHPKIVFLDTLASLSGADVKDDQSILPLMRWGGRLSTAYDTTVVWNAHDRKAREGETDDLDALFGSRQVSAQLDFAYRFLRGSKEDVRVRCTKMRVGVRREELYLEVVTQQDVLHSMRAKSLRESMSRMSRETAIVEAIREHLQGGGKATMSGTRDMVAKQVSRRPADVAAVLHELIAQGFVHNRGTDTRFDLEWLGDGGMSRMSQHVPDTLHADHVPVSHPRSGRTRDMGHADSGPVLVRESTQRYPCSGCGNDRVSFQEPNRLCFTCQQQKGDEAA